MSLSSNIAVVDFETKAIEVGYNYPPKPVGVAIGYPDGSRHYFAFGHPEGNNCSENDARNYLRGVYDRYDVLFHHAQFDLHVARKHWDLWPMRDYHDTMILVFLDAPHAQSFGLKESAKVILGIEPEERDRLRDWIVANVPAAKGKKRKGWGAFIADAPGDLVAPYACDDVRLPRALFEQLHDKVMANGMGEAYQRELRMAQVDMDMTDRGVRVDTFGLDRDSKIWLSENALREKEIRGRLGCGESVNLASGDERADALEAAGKVTEWVLTEKGNRSVSADALKVCCNDAELAGVFETFDIVDTCVSTFALPWLEMSGPDGRLHVQFNSTRRGDGNSSVGARTGRISTTPNIQNIIKPEKLKRLDLPFLRRYLIPSDGKIFLGRDYSSQEFRALGHFEDGPLLAEYTKDPRLDLHALVMRLIQERFGIVVSRDHVKIIGFGLLYGMGIGKLAKTMGVDLAEAKRIKDAYLAVISGVPLLIKMLKARAKAGEPIRTVGGRLYYCEAPRMVKGKYRTFDYKLLNYLIQGSSADITKMAMINADDALLELLLSIHDELLIEAPIDVAHECMAALRGAMESVPLDVPLLTDGKWSHENWGQMQKYDDNLYAEAA